MGAGDPAQPDGVFPPLSELDPKFDWELLNYRYMCLFAREDQTVLAAVARRNEPTPTLPSAIETADAFLSSFRQACVSVEWQL